MEIGRRSVLLALGILACSTSLGYARPKIGLALSGGGARGMAHVGVLKYIEQNNIPIDYIAGTSAGALVGGLYASGYTAGEIEHFFRTTDWGEVIFRDKAFRPEIPASAKIHHNRYFLDLELGLQGNKLKLPPGLLKGQRFGLLLQSAFLHVWDQNDFSKLPIPFKAVATDLETGEAVVLEKGNLAEAVRASSAYPGLFAPVKMNGRLLFDGGPSTNLPVEIVRKMGAEVIIAVDISDPLYSRKQLESFLAVMNQTISIVVNKQTRRELGNATISIVPDLSTTTILDYAAMDQLIIAGFKGAEAHAKELAKLSAKKTLVRTALTHVEQVRIDNIEVEGNSKVAEPFVRKHVRLKEGRLYTDKEIQKRLEGLYASGEYGRVHYHFAKSGQENILVIEVEEKEWGPNYFRLGFTWDGEIKGKQDFNGILNFEMTNLNDWGARWINDLQIGATLSALSEFRQPLGYKGWFFISPILWAARTDQDFYEQESRVAEYEIDRISGGADLGIDFGAYGEIRGGIRTGFISTELELGVARLQNMNERTGSIMASARIDQLDDAFLPRSGYYLSTDYVHPTRWLGSSSNYRRLSGKAMGFFNCDRNVYFGHAEGGTNLATEIPTYDEFMIGGFRSFSGFREEELQGEHYAVVRLGQMIRFAEALTPLWHSIIIGAWAEIGNTWRNKRDIAFEDLRYSGTLALGFDTRLGPVFFAYGQSGDSHRQFYISVGRTFGRIHENESVHF